MPEDAIEDSDSSSQDEQDHSKAFSLPRFIPLLRERISVLNPYARMFLVSWITLLDSIPDLELVTYLPSFLGGLFRLLDDPNQDVVTSTQHCLERFLEEIKIVARAKKQVAERRRLAALKSATSDASLQDGKPADSADVEKPENTTPTKTDDSASGENEDQREQENGHRERPDEESDSDRESVQTEEEFTPGQDVELNFLRILEILVDFLGDSSGWCCRSLAVKEGLLTAPDHIQLTALRWIDSFFDICPENLLPFAPGLLTQVLPALSSDIDQVRKAGTRVNSSLTEYILTLPDDGEPAALLTPDTFKSAQQSKAVSKGPSIITTQDAQLQAKPQALKAEGAETSDTLPSRAISPAPPTISETTASGEKTLDYESSVNALTRQFANKSEATRAAALSWLIMLQQKAPQKVSTPLRLTVDEMLTGSKGCCRA